MISSNIIEKIILKIQNEKELAEKRIGQIDYEIYALEQERSKLQILVDSNRDFLVDLKNSGVKFIDNINNQLSTTKKE